MEDAGGSPEQWLPVPDWEDLYEVSDRGRVRSLDRMRLAPLGQPYLKRGVVLKLRTTTTGYHYVTMRGDGRLRTARVHTLVLEAFVGPRPPDCEVLHRDGTKLNNAVSNLRWGTKVENSADSLKHGVHPSASKSTCPRLHRLIPPNLVDGDGRKGRRKCKACNRAHSRIYHYKRKWDIDLDLQTESDRYYALIMGGELRFSA